MKVLTAPGSGGVAVVATRDPAEGERLLAALRDRRGCVPVADPGGPPRLVRLVLCGRTVDECLLVTRRDGALELHLHGSRGVLDALAAEFVVEQEGLAPAERLLREAMDVGVLQLAAEQRQGSFEGFLAALRAMPPGERAVAGAAAIARSSIAMAQAEPVRVCLVGRQNAGKSTLFNLLLLQERALAGPLPGLTRDAVSARTSLGGHPVELVDTPGEGPAAGIDALAQERGRALRQGALLALVIDGSVGPDAGDMLLARDAALVVATRADLPQAPWPAGLPCDLRVHGLDLAAAPAVRAAFGAKLRAFRQLPEAGPVGGPAALDASQLQQLHDALRSSCAP